MKTIVYSVLLFQTIFTINSIGSAQTKNETLQAYTASVSATSGDSNAAAGTFRTMESIRYGMLSGYKGIAVKVEQPVCPGHSGTLALVNSSGEGWKYKVIEKSGRLISEGDVGYDRRISNLHEGKYMIQFTLSNGLSALDEFSITPGKGLEATLVAETNSDIPLGNQLTFIGTCEGGSEFIWDFGDGQVVYGTQSIEHSYSKPGKYTVKLTSNNFDCTAQASTEVSIVSQPAIVSGE